MSEWIDFKSGDPYPRSGQVVEIRLRGEFNEDVTGPAEQWNWAWDESADIRIRGGEIVAYRVVPEPQRHSGNPDWALEPPETYTLPTAYDITTAATTHMESRADTYDAPGGERSMAKTVAMFNELHNQNVTEVQGWQFMEILKMVRSSQGAFRVDNFEDGCAYAALAGEAAAKEIAQ